MLTNGTLLQHAVFKSFINKEYKPKNNGDIFSCFYECCCVSVLELYTVKVLTEAAMMGADIDGDVLLYLDMAQVSVPLTDRIKMYPVK